MTRSPIALAENLVLKVFATEFPPFSGVNLPDQGLAITELKQFAQTHDFQIDVAFVPAARAISLTLTNGWQATIVGVPESADRPGNVMYSEKTVKYGLISKQAVPNKPIEDQTIGVIRAAGGIGPIQSQLINTGSDLVEVTSLTQAFRMLEAGRIDSVLGVYFNESPIGMPSTLEEPLVMHTTLTEIPFVLYLNLGDPTALRIYQRITGAD